MTTSPSLTFKNGKWQLYISPTKLSYTDVGEGWEKIDSDLFETTQLKAAARFKHLSDGIAEKVFQRAFAVAFGCPSLPPLSFLDPHQIDGVKWCLTRSRSYLAHAPGAGKTAQAIVAACLSEGEGSVVFIVPPSLTANWEREIIKFTELLDKELEVKTPAQKDLLVWPIISTLPTTAKQSDMGWSAPYIIIPDTMLAKSWVYKRLSKLKIKFLAVDEASRFKEITSLRSKAFYGGSTTQMVYHGIYQTARHTVFLDGSPMPNRPMELWAPTYALFPQAIDCMSRTDFGFRYCGATMNERGQWEFNHSSNETELKERLQKDFMHVVTEDKLAHPERRRSMYFIGRDLRSAEHKTWEQKHLHKIISSGEVDEASSQGDLARFRRELGISKIPHITSYVFDRLNNKSESILLFAWHREVCEELAQRLSKFKPALVIGGTDNAKREKFFDEFQRGKRRLIIGNISAMGRGHNLQRADRAIFGEYSWSGESNLQCEKRASRRGRDISAFVRCEYIVSPGSMDEKILTTIFTKDKSIKKVIG